MKTVEELRERHEDFSFEEALDEAVRLRRRMLDDMVPEPDDLEAVEDLDDVGGDVMNGVKSYLSHRRRRL